MSIPKIIHYCWFGNQSLPALGEKCIASWRRFCPEYKIVRWDEGTFNVQCNEYCQKMWQEKKWAFLSDYVRLKVVYDYGGIYLDTDVEVIRSIDELLSLPAFMGWEDDIAVATGLGFGAEPLHPFLKKNMCWYEEYKNDICKKITNCTYITTEALQNTGIQLNPKEKQMVQNVVLFPSEYFCPKSYESGEVKVTENTFSIHHYAASWQDKRHIFYHSFYQKFHMRIDWIDGIYLRLRRSPIKNFSILMKKILLFFRCNK